VPAGDGVPGCSQVGLRERRPQHNPGCYRGQTRALYYHFGSKKALGYAIVEEIIATSMRDKWLRPFQNGADPVDTLIRTVQATSLRPAVVRAGCPLNNLAQEMSQRDERFRKYLAKVCMTGRKA
jgi:AcrR family transcriptional regulator